MKIRWLPTRRELLLFPQVLFLFLAALVPVMFLFSVIVGFYQYNQHRELLSALQTYGRKTEAVINSIDRENGRGYIFLACPREAEEISIASVHILSLYPADWLESLAPGQTLTILYVATRYHEYSLQAVPLDFYPQIKRSPGITPDIWSLFGIFLFIAILKPHFLFLGMIKLEDLLRDQLPTEFFP